MHPSAPYSTKVRSYSVLQVQYSWSLILAGDEIGKPLLIAAKGRPEEGGETYHGYSEITQADDRKFQYRECRFRKMRKVSVSLFSLSLRK